MIDCCISGTGDGLCACDLLVSQCDALCCCDMDCSCSSGVVFDCPTERYVHGEGGTHHETLQWANVGMSMKVPPPCEHSRASLAK